MKPIGAVLSAGAGTTFMEVASHREYVGSMVKPCWNCGSRSIVAETYGSGLEIRCLHCCRDQRKHNTEDTWKNVVIYVATKLGKVA
jgi:hypothetical protein